MLLRTNRNSTPLAADPTAAVLIADPHAIVADLLARHLRPYYRVFAPISRFGFVPDAIRLGRPVLAVLEMEFGDQSVIPFVREVRRCAGAPMILILSARASELDREVARLAGAEEVVSKRDGLTSLIGAIGLALRRLSVAAISDTPQQLDRVLASHSRGGQATVHRDV